MNCFYCKHDIIRNEPGWGWSELFKGAVSIKLKTIFWHTECFEVTEEVPIEDIKLIKKRRDDWDSRGFENSLT